MANGAQCNYHTSTEIVFSMQFQVFKRVAPTFTILDDSITIELNTGGAIVSTSSTIDYSYCFSPGQGFAMRVDGFTSVNSSTGYQLWQSTNWLEADAEL